jgi:hypothetical protein
MYTLYEATNAGFDPMLSLCALLILATIIVCALSMTSKSPHRATNDLRCVTISAAGKMLATMVFRYPRYEWSIAHRNGIEAVVFKINGTTVINPMPDADRSVRLDKGYGLGTWDAYCLAMFNARFLRAEADAVAAFL